MIDGISNPHSQPFYRLKVHKDWVDYNGHMNEAIYLKVFSQASDAYMARFGIDQDYVASGFSYFTAETHIRHLCETHLGKNIAIKTTLVSWSPNTLHLFHDLYEEEEKEGGQENVGEQEDKTHKNNPPRLCATGEHMLVHVDLKNRKSITAPFYLQERFAAVCDPENPPPLPEGAGRAITPRF